MESKIKVSIKKRSKTKRIAIKITGTKFEKKKFKSNDVGWNWKKIILRK